MIKSYFTSQGIQTYTNPLTQDGLLIHAVNVVSFPLGAKSKRPGYSAFLGTPDNAQIQSLFSFPKQDGTTLWLYRASGSALYYSQQGTGAWTLAGNGTISNGAHFGAAVLSDTLIGGDGIGSTRHTTSGTTLTNTTAAPIGEHYAEYQRKVYIAGTASTIINSTTNDATNWSSSGTSDSTSFTVSGGGKLGRIFKTPDQLNLTKSTGLINKWDGFSLIDMSTNNGPSSPYSVARTENGYNFYINQFGHFGYSGANPQLLSNAVQRYFYNRQSTGIAGTLFPTIPAECHIYDYFASIGTVTDDLVRRPINNAVLNYNYQKNEYLVWQMADNPTAYHSYVDATSKRQLIFGNATGQCFQLDPTSTTDNGSVINTELVYFFNYGTLQEKVWQWIVMSFNPGCEVNIQAAFSDTFTYEHLQWFDIVDNSPNVGQGASDGVVEYHFPHDSRSRFLFIRIYESSPNSQWTYYGSDIVAEVLPIK